MIIGENVFRMSEKTFVTRRNLWNITAPLVISCIIPEQQHKALYVRSEVPQSDKSPSDYVMYGDRRRKYDIEWSVIAYDLIDRSVHEHIVRYDAPITPC